MNDISFMITNYTQIIRTPPFYNDLVDTDWGDITKDMLLSILFTAPNINLTMKLNN